MPIDPADRQQDYLLDPSLLEVVDSERCDRCHRNGWRCFIEADADSPRRVCRPCGKNKCSYGNAQGSRPATKPHRYASKPPKPRYEPYRRELPGVAALTAWAPPPLPLTPPTEPPTREGSLELLAEAAHQRTRSPLPEGRPAYRQPMFNAWDVEDTRFFDLIRHYADNVPRANRFHALTSMYHATLLLPAYR